MSYNFRDRSKVTKVSAWMSSYEAQNEFKDRPLKRARTKPPQGPSTSRNNGEGTNQMETAASGVGNNENGVEAAGEGGRRRIPSGPRKTILSWLTEIKKLRRNARVQYVNPANGEVAAVGRINRAGIKCRCCANIYNVWTFEEHAGGAHLKKPYDNIVVPETRRPLSSYLNEAWLVEKPADDEFGTRYLGSKQDNHDNACMVCADGGNLICCEGCSSTYHHHCMNMEMLPEHAWYCPYCICKFCGLRHGPKTEFLTCFQCEKKFHFLCSDGFSRHQQRESVVNDNANPLIVAFCGHGCREIFEKLEGIVGVKHTLRGTMSWTLIRRTHPRAGVYIKDAHQRLECNSKTLLAWSVLDEGFESSIDNLTSTDVIRNITFNCGFGSNYTRLNHSGFYTIILERKDEIISAATLRMHGTKLAEMPFISTRPQYRMKKMSRKLVNAVEFILRSMKIETLVIPSIADVEGMWRNKYGFHRVGDDMMRELSQWNTLMIHSTIRMQKGMLSRAEETCRIRGMENSEIGNGDHHDNRKRSLILALGAAAGGRIQYHGSSSTTTKLKSGDMGASTSGTKKVDAEAENTNDHINIDNVVAPDDNDAERRPLLDLNRPWRCFDLNEPASEAEED